MNYEELGLFGLVAVLIFSALVFESFVYLISKGALDWGPLQVSRRQDPLRAADRTTSSTVRRVGQDGRVQIAVGADEADELSHPEEAPLVAATDGEVAA